MSASEQAVLSSHAARCRHCGAPSGAAAFCCVGCEAVYGLLQAEHLDRYYDLRGPQGPPAPAASATPDRKWLEALDAELLRSVPGDTAGPRRIALDVQGIHCAACVWLLEELFRRRAGGLRALVNPALGQLELIVGPGFALGAYVAEVERFGYRLGPSRKNARPASASSGLLARLGVCAAIAMNIMLFAISIYAGVEGPLRQLFLLLQWTLATLSVVVGGSVFLRSAWHALRRRMLHLDLPIALGVLLAWGGSTWSFFARAGEGAYFDTLAVFITLMLFGRWLQDRVLERNRRQILSSDGVDGLLARRLTADGTSEIVPCTTLRAGDRLLLAPGDLVCLDARLEDARADFSLDWIDGESAPRAFAAGAAVPAGAFHVGRAAITAVATQDFDASALVRLLAAPARRDADTARATPWWRQLARAWVVGVLLAAGGAFVLWLALSGDVGRAIEVTTAVLIVTCPCAFGIATPLGYELVQAGLRRAGLFVRAPGFLDRARSVRRVVFDKTGTLTTGALRVADLAPLETLDHAARRMLYNLAVRSSHPRSAAVAQALVGLPGAPPRLDDALRVTEVAGRGLECLHHGRTWRLGAPDWAAPGAMLPDVDLAFATSGVLRAALRTVEEPRRDAAAEVAALRVEGYDVWILSGDAPARTRALGAELGVPVGQALGGATPDDKAAWLAANDHADTLFIGDGINDSLAVERAFCSGTPAIDRPFLPARSDFYFTTAGLRPVRLALAASQALARVTRRNLAVAVTYNVGAVTLAYLGVMSPLLCAIVMPATSLTVVLATAASLSRRAPLWKAR